MNTNALKLSIFALLGFACFYLIQVDYSSKLETDISSLLPTVETDEARLARRLISEEQGRAVYIEISGLPEDDLKADQLELIALKRFEKHALVSSIVRVDESLNFKAFKWVADHRLELLFPQWLFEKRERFDEEVKSSNDFFEWAAQSAVEDMDDFLASPMAMELARPELMDPLLLNIGSVLKLNESGVGGIDQNLGPGPNQNRLYWLTLSESALSPVTQTELADLIKELGEQLRQIQNNVEIRYGGLVNLAGTSRSRIQGDIFKINSISIIGVLLISYLLLRKPWRLLLVFPALISGVIGAVSISFLVFDRVNALVLVVGSILIGTAIDYAIHLIFSGGKESEFPTRKLVALACFSTVTGFLILLFADLALIRQIGVFVGSGLLCAYMVASVTSKARFEAEQTTLRKFWKVKSRLPTVVALVLVIFAGYGLMNLNWKDDIRNLEAPDSEGVRMDIELREQFGFSGSGSLFLTTGSSYLNVFENEARLMESVKTSFPGITSFGVSAFLPNRSQLEILNQTGADVAQFFEALKSALTQAGYELEGFSDFFKSALLFSESLVEKQGEIEDLIKTFSQRLEGPLAGVIGEHDGRYWSLSTIDLSEEKGLSITSAQENVVLFSQLSFLNKTLDQHRNTLFRFGGFAMLVVSIILVITLGKKKGILVIVFPILGGGCAIGLCQLLFDELNMFHLIGCFLGGTIALDYALFSVESYERNLKIPHSVWLSAGTTSASFLALSFSAIPVVRSLGTMVALLACITLLLLHSSKTFLCKRFSIHAFN